VAALALATSAMPHNVTTCRRRKAEPPLHLGGGGKMQLAHANMNNDSALLVAMVDILKQSLNRQHLPPNKNKQSIYTYIEEANTLAGAFPSFSGTGVLFGNSVSPAQCT